VTKFWCEPAPRRVPGRGCGHTVGCGTFFGPHGQTRYMDTVFTNHCTPSPLIRWQSSTGVYTRCELGDRSIRSFAPCLPARSRRHSTRRSQLLGQDFVALFERGRLFSPWTKELPGRERRPAPGISSLISSLHVWAPVTRGAGDKATSSFAQWAPSVDDASLCHSPPLLSVVTDWSS
jgi:hypothetical protein